METKGENTTQKNLLAEIIQLLSNNIISPSFQNEIFDIIEALISRPQSQDINDNNMVNIYETAISEVNNLLKISNEKNLKFIFMVLKILIILSKNYPIKFNKFLCQNSDILKQISILFLSRSKAIIIECLSLIKSTIVPQQRFYYEYLIEENFFCYFFTLLHSHKDNIIYSAILDIFKYIYNINSIILIDYLNGKLYEQLKTYSHIPEINNILYFNLGKKMDKNPIFKNIEVYQEILSVKNSKEDLLQTKTEVNKANSENQKYNALLSLNEKKFQNLDQEIEFVKSDSDYFDTGILKKKTYNEFLAQSSESKVNFSELDEDENIELAYLEKHKKKKRNDF